MPTAYWIPYTRSSWSAWDETSITACVQPASAMRRSSPCSSKDSGVVRSVWITSLPIMFWMVPIRPTFAPAFCSRMLLMR